jgi:hypothetical protein
MPLESKYQQLNKEIKRDIASYFEDLTTERSVEIQ